jgi:cytochrome c oxidase cbb3-type subunit 3
MSKKEHDDFTGTELTGHEWDGIKELNTPLPRWWLWTFYATVLWAVGYMIAYPAWPLVSAATPGILGYSSRADVANELASAKVAQGDLLKKVAELPLEDIRNDPALLSFATAGGRAAFRVNCIQCHGSGAAGGSGYPNLNDDEWIWGGTLEQIHTTLQHGIRVANNPDTRQSVMPAFGADNILTPAQISDTAEYVLKLAGHEHDAAAADRAVQLYAENCAACHGEDGKGNRELGSPNLTDAIGLYVSDKASIVAQISRPRQGVMPAWSGRLDEPTIKQLAIYVHSLGGGETAAPAQ